MTPLRSQCLSEQDLLAYEAVRQSPVTVLQVGEGNFLRGFVDWMLQQSRAQGLFNGSVAVTQPRPGGKAKIETLAAQDGLYTLVVRGLENGQPVERQEIISVIREAFDPYGNWDKWESCAASAELKFVVSNTTEAGLQYRPEPLNEGQPIQSFPGKIAYLLHKRFEAFGGSPEAGLIFLPCELLDRNGDELKACVLQYSDDWGYSEEFKAWVVSSNRFLNSLVDRIVTGYPAEQAEGWFEAWGYEDHMLNSAEPYHLWAIEGEPELDELLPLRKAGLNVHWVNDLKPFQLRKVRILNGAHTLMTPLSLVLGLEQVREVMEHPELGRWIREAVEQEIIPSMPMDREELEAYAHDVYDRFLNPFIRHRLYDIAMNSISKFKVRLLPSLLHYETAGGRPPQRLVRGFAGLLRYYKVSQTADGGYAGTDLQGKAYTVRDDAEALAALAEEWARPGQTVAQTAERLLSRAEVWGQDLSRWSGLADALAAELAALEGAAVHE
ncbi:tagaturonate reductase [Paenibacillus protaetiae]|uniref:Tagaturonate reductase n=1 Tax=Paenibacillus protaetiae TaxID=2509456 RepID=A0A4P6EUK2_9BACL|nr:tagaturonate reductase [Paenibacillus protaetiae]QAY66930.1 tagaturonate reductase [Paenibacillus protaetiae]